MLFVSVFCLSFKTKRKTKESHATLKRVQSWGKTNAWQDLLKPAAAISLLYNSLAASGHGTHSWKKSGGFFEMEFSDWLPCMCPQNADWCAKTTSHHASWASLMSGWSCKILASWFALRWLNLGPMWPRISTTEQASYRDPTINP